MAKCVALTNRENMGKGKELVAVAQNRILYKMIGVLLLPLVRTIKNLCLYLIHPFIHFFHKKK